jgi:hypothetical protein
VSRWVRIGLAWQVALALLSSATEGVAEAPKGAVARLRAQADAAKADGRLAESRDLWIAIWRLDRSQVAACTVGALSYRLDKQPDAVRWLSLCKETMRKPATPQERALYESRLVELEQARLRVGELRVHAPAGASITIDDVPAEAGSGVPIPVDPGRHVVHAELRGAPARAEVDVPRGETRDVTLTFPTTVPNGTARPAENRVARGPTKIPSPEEPRVGVVVGGIGASTAFLALGAGLRAFARGQEEMGLDAARDAGPSGCYRRTSPGCEEAIASWDTMETARAWSTTSLVVGGVLAAATLGYVVYPRGRAEVTVSAEGFTVRGAW